MRVLFITAAPPATMVGGGGAATNAFLRLLGEAPLNAEITLCCLQEASSRLPHRLRQLEALCRAMVSSLPSKTLFAAPRGTATKIRNTLQREAFDLVAINGSELFCLALSFPAEQRTIGLAHNLESDLYAGQTSRIRGLPLLGRWFERDVERLRQTEARGAERVHGILCLSSDDAAKFEQRAPGIRVLTQPTTFSYPPYRRGTRTPVRPLRLGFLAKYEWWPNHRAAQWMIDEVMQALPADVAQLLLFGPGAERFADSAPNVIIRGFVDELSEVWEQSDIVVCPVVTGFGINIKFIEAVYNGCPVLATSLSTRGLELVPDPAIKLLDDAAQWRDFIGSQAAMELATREPLPANADRYAHEAAAIAFARFVTQVMSSRAS